MVFWNPKKKRTTAKPKTTASISKPKVGSVKQELNILPQPKKTDNPKPNKVPKNEDVKKQFLKTFNQLTYRHRSWDVWRDFIIMFACSLSNPVDKFHYEEREKRYLKIIKKYNKREQEQFPELAAYVVMALEENPEQDFLGSIFMELNLGDKSNSQFFTPYHVCELMAKVTEEDVAAVVKEKGYIRLRNRILVNMDFKRQTVSHHEDVFVRYSIEQYKDVGRTRWDPYKNEPITNAAGLCYIWRKIVNTDESRQLALLEIVEKHPRAIIFYNFDYELELLKELFIPHADTMYFEIAEWNGHKHQPIPKSESWVYLVQYNAGAEGWNCIKTDTIIFYSQNYSYKIMQQSAGRIDRLNTPFKDLYYYHLKSRSGIDLAISKALKEKKDFNETRFVKW